MMFSRTVRPGNTRRPSGTCAMPSRTIACGPRPAIGLPSNTIVARRGSSRPEIARSVVDLPAPFAPSSVTTSPFVDREGNAAQRLDLAIAHVETVDFEQRHRGASEIGGDRHRDGAAHRLASPSAMRRPKLSTVMCCATFVDERHVVVDDEDGEAAWRAIRSSRSCSALLLARVEAGRRLVQQQQQSDCRPARARSRSDADGRS